MPITIDSVSVLLTVAGMRLEMTFSSSPIWVESLLYRFPIRLETLALLTLMSLTP